MKRNLKVLGLALVAVLAMTAVAAAGASAAQFHSEVASTTLKGSQIGTDVFTTNAGTVKCNEATYLGSQSGTTANDASLTPTYTECTAFGFAGATITMNGCSYKFHAEPAVDVVCPEGKSIVIVAKLAGTTKCTVNVGAQTGLKTISYGNEGAGSGRSIKATVGISGIAYSQTAGSGLGACKSESGLTNGTYTGEASVKGFNEGGTQVGIWWE